MKCEDFLRLIDAYIDGELDQAQLRDMQLHAQECENCSRELELAKILNDTLHVIDDAVVPPLPAQAAWRNAVKAESRSKRMRKLYKIGGSIAAALVLVIGCATGIKAIMPGDTEPVQQDHAALYVIAADGDSAPESTELAAATSARSAKDASYAAVKLDADDPNAACESIAALAGEFSGNADSASISDSSAYITVYIPATSYDQFIEALNYTGAVTSSQFSGSGDTVTVAITIKKR